MSKILPEQSENPQISPVKIQLQKGGNEIGPLSWIEVFVMLQKGDVDYQTPARFEGDEKWRSIDELDLWREGDEVGPFTWQEIAYLVEQGCLDGRVKVRPEGSDDLVSLEDVSEIPSASTDPEPSVEEQLTSQNPASFFDLIFTSKTMSRISHLLRCRPLRASLVYAGVLIVGFLVGWLTNSALRESSSISVEAPDGLRDAQPVAASHSHLTAISSEETTQSPAALPNQNIYTGQQAVSDISGDSNNSPETTSAGQDVNPEEPPLVSTEAPREPNPPPVVNNESQPILREPPAREADDQGQNQTVVLPQPPEDAQPKTTVKPPESMKGARSLGNPSPPPVPAPSLTKKIRPFETPQLTEQELEELLLERFSSLPIKIPESYDERPGKGLLIHEGTFTLDTQLVHNPKVEIVYRVPLHSKNRPGPDADNIVMVGIYHGAIQPRTKKMLDGKEISEKSRLHGALTPFADQLGYTAFTMHIATTPEMASDQREYYAYGGPDWVDVVYRAKAEIEKRHKLKERKLLLFGTSEGGQFVQNIAAAAPEKVAAVSTQSGPNITPPDAASETAWFLAITRGDAMQSAYETVYNRLLEQNASVVFNIFPPNYKGRGLGGNFYHSQSAIATLASRSFIRGVVDRYDSKNNIDRTKWPYLRDRTKPLRIYPSGSYQAKAIPEANREYLPSRAFAQCLQAVPAPMQAVTLTSDGVRTVKAFVGVPPLGKPKGTIIYSQAFNILDLQHMFDNIYYLAAMGYVVIAPQMRKSDPQDILSAAEFAIKSNVLGKFPMAMVGYGPKANLAWDVVARNREIAPKAVALLEFTPRDSFDESKLPPGCRMDAPIVFVYDEYPLVDVATSDEAKKSMEIVSAVKEFVTKCNERKQLAKVVIVPKPEQKKNARPVAAEEAAKLERVRVAQLSLEAAERFITKVVENRRSEIEP